MHNNHGLRLLTALLLALLCGCGADKLAASAVVPQTPARSYSLGEMLAQVNAAPMPGVAPDVADGLRRSLSSALIASGQTRFASSVSATAVDDFTLANNGDGTATAHWSYRNTGDLDQNSEVNVSDLSALGANLGRKSTDADWNKYVPIDADGNGEINISDISALGAHLLERIESYTLQVSLDGGGNWDDVEVVPFSESHLPDGGGRRVFDHVINAAQYGAQYQLVNGEEGTGGKASNFAWFRDPPPAPVNFTASDGTIGGLVRCTWDAVDDADSYTVWRADQPDGEPAALGTTTGLTYDDETAALNVTYDYYVTSTNTGGDSGPSNVDSGFNDGTTDPGLFVLSPPAGGDGSALDPYLVSTGDSYDLQLIDAVDGDVSDSPSTSYTSSDAAHVTITGHTMTIGAGAEAHFDIYGSYNGVNSNRVYFHLSAGPSSLTIMPDDLVVAPWSTVVSISDAVPPDQLGTMDHPFVLHDNTFNPDTDSDGTFDTEFTLRAEDGMGNPVDPATLTWGAFPPFVALDINDASKGTFHANQFSVGYVFAQDNALTESNHLYVEVKLDQN